MNKNKTLYDMDDLPDVSFTTWEVYEEVVRAQAMEKDNES